MALGPVTVFIAVPATAPPFLSCDKNGGASTTIAGYSAILLDSNLITSDDAAIIR